MNRLLLSVLWLLPLSLLASTIVPADTSNTDKEKEKHEQLLEFIESKEFVLEAASLYDRYGRMAFVNPSSNFFVLSKGRAVVQIGFNYGAPGSNGLGGVTLEGKVTQFEIKDRGVGNGVHLRMSFSGNASATILMEISDEGQGIVHYSGMKGERLRLKGEVVDMEESSIFVGTTSY